MPHRPRHAIGGVADDQVVEAEIDELLQPPRHRRRRADQVLRQVAAQIGGVRELPQVGEHAVELLVARDIAPGGMVGLVVLDLQGEEFRQVFQRLGLGRRVGLGDEALDGDGEGDVGRAAGGGGAVLPGLQDAAQQLVGEGREAQRRQAEIGHDRGALQAADGAVEARHPALQRRPQHGRRGPVGVMAGMGHRPALQRLPGELPGLAEAVAGGLHADPEGIVFRLRGAAAHADMQLPVAQRLQHRHVLGEAHRVVPGQHHDRGAEAEARAGRGDVGEEQQRVGLRVVVAEMVLHHPGGVVAQPVQQLGIGDRLAVELAVAQTRLPHGADLVGEAGFGCHLDPPRGVLAETLGFAAPRRQPGPSTGGPRRAAPYCGQGRRMRSWNSDVSAYGARPTGWMRRGCAALLRSVEDKGYGTLWYPESRGYGTGGAGQLPAGEQHEAHRSAARSPISMRAMPSPRGGRWRP